MLLASKSRRMGSLYMYPPLYPYSDSAMAYAYMYAYARHMRGEVQGARPRLFFRFEKIAGSQRIIKIRLSTVFGVKPGGKGHRLDRIVPFHDLIMLLCPFVVPGHCCGLFI